MRAVAAPKPEGLPASSPVAPLVLPDNASRLHGEVRAVPAVLPPILVHSDPAGAAYLMKELVGLGGLTVALEEENGRWSVAVQPSDDVEPILRRVLNCTLSCAAAGHMQYASMSVGDRTYTVHPDPPEPAAFAA